MTPEEDYQIRYVRLDEADKLQSFIDQYWKQGHILAHNKLLLDYQHKNLTENRYNFVGAYNTITGNFDIVLGFIPRSQYDENFSDRDIWLAIWKKNDLQLPRGMGTKLLDYLETEYKPNTIGSIGINENIEQLYLKRGWKSGTLDHWYFLKTPPLISFIQNELRNSTYYENPFCKTPSYYENRYDNHPFYKYKNFQGVVYRKIETKSGSCLRIVDFKDKFYLDGFSLNELLVTESADYIDCLNHGLPVKTFTKMGFRKRDHDMTIPQWFEPLDLGVADIKFAYKSNTEYFIVKGDSDQDRPNQIPASATHSN